MSIFRGEKIQKLTKGRDRGRKGKALVNCQTGYKNAVV